MTTIDRLLSLVDQLGPEESEVLRLQAERMVIGQRAYGPFCLARDKRNFPRQALMEFIDAATYFSAAVLRLEALLACLDHERVSAALSAFRLADESQREALQDTVAMLIAGAQIVPPDPSTEPSAMGVAA